MQTLKFTIENLLEERSGIMSSTDFLCSLRPEKIIEKLYSFIKYRVSIRSKTFWGIADAMASQWGNFNIE